MVAAGNVSLHLGRAEVISVMDILKTLDRQQENRATMREVDRLRERRFANDAKSRKNPGPAAVGINRSRRNRAAA
jgi:hypothetical protein